jgi:hypothetical protein
MGLDSEPAKAEAQASPAAGTRMVRSVELYERLENSFAQTPIDAGAGVDDPNLDASPHGRRSDSNGGLRRRVTDGVFDQVDEDSLQEATRVGYFADPAERTARHATRR